MKKLIEVRITRKIRKEREAERYGCPGKDDVEIGVSVETAEDFNVAGEEAKLIELLRTRLESI